MGWESKKVARIVCTGFFGLEFPVFEEKDVSIGRSREGSFHMGDLCSGLKVRCAEWGWRIHCTSAISPSVWVQSNQYAKIEHFGAACAWSLQHLYLFNRGSKCLLQEENRSHYTVLITVYKFAHWHSNCLWHKEEVAFR